MTQCFLSSDGKPCVTLVSMPIRIYMRHLLPRTCLLLIKTENPYDLSPDCASGPAISSRKWYCSNCSLFAVFSIGPASLHTAPHKQEGFSLFTPWQFQALELVWTSRQTMSPERSNRRASREAGEGWDVLMQASTEQIHLTPSICVSWSLAARVLPSAEAPVTT